MSFTLNLINQASEEAKARSQKSQDRREHEVRDILQRHLRRWGGRVGLCLEEVRRFWQEIKSGFEECDSRFQIVDLC